VADNIGLQVKKEYYSVLTDLFDTLKFNKGNEWKAMMILANVRNGMHNNGVHKSNSNDKLRQNPSILYRENQVTFAHGFPIGGITDDLLASISSDIVAYFEMVVQSDKVLEVENIKDISVIF